MVKVEVDNVLASAPLNKAIVNGISEKKWSYNPVNGEIKTYENKEEFDADMAGGVLVSVNRPPSKNCKFCYGRGYAGRYVQLNYYLPCRCLFKKGK